MLIQILVLFLGPCIPIKQSLFDGLSYTDVAVSSYKHKFLVYVTHEYIILLVKIPVKTKIFFDHYL